ncbi:DUF5067 domain-containing protein [Collinsella sp. LCP19S3_C6]|uniref:DUF5067 domain-containing protein n=1 Tax=unclassified Collinsella TaxID=2637548 RepID=UPI003F891BEB
MGLSTTALIPRRAFLALGLTAASACLTACSGKGSYDDGYAAGYAAAQADAAGKEKDGSGGDGDIPVSGIVYTITGAQRGVESYSDGKPLLILNVTAKNVSEDLQTVMFSGNEILAFQDGKGLNPSMLVEGLDLPESRQIQPGTVLEGWLGYELIDETTPVECEAGGQIASSDNNEAIYGLTNPQIIDLSTL